jgi:hypothetical protein
MPLLPSPITPTTVQVGTGKEGEETDEEEEETSSGRSL